MSVSLPEGKILDQADDLEIKQRGEVEPETVAGRAIVALGDSLVDAKVDFVRCWFPWKYFEPFPVLEASLASLLENSYNQWPLEDLVDSLTGRGIDVVPVIACGYQRMLPQGLEPDPNRVLYLKRASIHARLLARHYKDRIKNWQIENEPNWWAEHEAGGWRSGLAWVHERGFRQELLQTLNDSVHAEDPSAVTIINLEADARVFEPGPYSSYCDVLGLDFYPNYKISHPINTKVLKAADQVAKKFSKTVMISETGYPSGPSILGYSAESQAKYVTESCEVAHQLDGVTGIGIWRYIDTAWRSFPPQENHFGLFDNRGGPKPAWNEFSRVIKELK